MKVRSSDLLVYWLARAAIGTAARVPQWLGYTFADWLGRLFFCCNRRRRRYALRLLRNAFPQLPERELLRIGSRATGNLFKVPLDMARLTRLLARGDRIETVLDYREARRHFSTAPPWVGLTAHLGNGCSCTAVRDGKSVDTTMGLTPLEGVMMGTRSGSVDPAIIGHVAEEGERQVQLLRADPAGAGEVGGEPGLQPAELRHALGRQRQGDERAGGAGHGRGLGGCSGRSVRPIVARRGRR